MGASSVTGSGPGSVAGNRVGPILRDGTIPYPANVGVVWDGLRPETVVDAIDRLASYTQDYSVNDPTDWSGTPPSELRQAIDRLATLVKALNGGVGA